MPKVFTTDELISNSTDIIDQWTIINENVYEIVNGVTQELDDYINGLPKNMTNLPDEELEGIIMEIPLGKFKSGKDWGEGGYCTIF